MSKTLNESGRDISLLFSCALDSASCSLIVPADSSESYSGQIITAIIAANKITKTVLKIILLFALLSPLKLPLWTLPFLNFCRILIHFAVSAIIISITVKMNKSYVTISAILCISIKCSVLHECFHKNIAPRAIIQTISLTVLILISSRKFSARFLKSFSLGNGSSKPVSSFASIGMFSLPTTFHPLSSKLSSSSLSTMPVSGIILYFISRGSSSSNVNTQRPAFFRIRPCLAFSSR